MNDYEEETLEEYEARVEALIAHFQTYVDIFAKDLEEECLSRRTTKRHISNVKTFLTHYVVYYHDYDCESIEDTADVVSSFLGSYIPDKYIGSTSNLIRENGTSLRKFYKCMLRHGHISQDIYRSVSEDISEEISDGGERYFTFVREFKEDNGLL